MILDAFSVNQNSIPLVLWNESLEVNVRLLRSGFLLNLTGRVLSSSERKFLEPLCLREVDVLSAVTSLTITI